jgi:hypothetical protein
LQAVLVKRFFCKSGQFQKLIPDGDPALFGLPDAVLDLHRVDVAAAGLCGAAMGEERRLS